MKKIDIYVDEICHKFNESDKEIETLKEEMRSHLYEEVEELKKQGFSEEESIEKALSSFGKEKNVVKEMNTIWKKENEFTIIILKGAIVTFIIGCLFMAASLLYKNNNEGYVNSTSEYTINAIFKGINSKDNFKKDEIDKSLSEFNKKNNNGLYYVKIEKLNNIKYEYKKDVAKDVIKNGYEGKIIKGDWKIYYKKTDLQQEKDLENLYKLTELKANPVNAVFKQIAYALFLFVWFILCMAFYNYLGGSSKIILGIAILDIGFGALVVAEAEFPNNIKMATICILAACLIAFLIFKICFIKKKISHSI